MTTNITELAQSLKAAAEKATPGPWEVQFGEEIYATDGVDNEQVAIATLDARDADYIAMANPANVLALVEALEKAQQVDEELCKLLPPGVEYMDPPDGGDVEPIEQVRRMVADYRQRIAEQESRTVTVKLPEPPGPMSVGARTVYFGIVADVVSAFQYGLTAAGIKVEAE